MGVVAQVGPIEPRQCFVSNSDLRSSEESKQDTSLKESLTFWAFSIQGTFWASCALCLACDIQVLSVPGHPTARSPSSYPAPALVPCVWFFWARNSWGQLALAKATSFVPYKPVPHVSLNKSQRLPCLAGTRAVCFFHMVWALGLCFEVSVFLPFLCVQLKTESLPTQENCSDALKGVWIPFWKRYSKFFWSDCWWEGQNQQNNNDSKYSSWGRNFCLYNLESDKIQETSQRTPSLFSV